MVVVVAGNIVESDDLSSPLLFSPLLSSPLYYYLHATDMSSCLPCCTLSLLCPCTPCHSPPTVEAARPTYVPAGPLFSTISRISPSHATAPCRRTLTLPSPHRPHPLTSSGGCESDKRRRRATPAAPHRLAPAAPVLCVGLCSRGPRDAVGEGVLVDDYTPRVFPVPTRWAMSCGIGTVVRARVRSPEVMDSRGRVIVGLSWPLFGLGFRRWNRRGQQARVSLTSAWGLDTRCELGMCDVGSETITLLVQTVDTAGSTGEVRLRLERNSADQHRRDESQQGERDSFISYRGLWCGWPLMHRSRTALFYPSGTAYDANAPAPSR